LYDIVCAARVAQMEQSVPIEVVTVLRDVGLSVVGGIHARQSKRFAFSKQECIDAALGRASAP
jgi:hypothetical protein